MGRYSEKERVFLMEKYCELKSFTKVKRAWRSRFKNLPAPSCSTIKYQVDKLRNKYSLIDQNPKKREPSDARKHCREQLGRLIGDDPTLSIRKLSSAIGVSYSLTRDVLVNELKLKPYKYQEYQELKPGDSMKRMEFARWFLEKCPGIISNSIFSDEAYFYLHEAVNKQNNRLWLREKPDDWIERPLNDQKLLVWCGISADRIFGPFIFQSTVNQQNYLEMLKTYLWPKILNTRDYKRLYFQQDGATAHTANSVQEWLTSKLGSKFMDKKRWPPRSPDLNPCDFFLWGYLKSKVYSPIPKDLDQLKSNLEREIRAIKKETLKSCFLNLKKRCDLIVKQDGDIIENKL